MATPLQFATRTQKDIRVFDADPVYADLPGFEKPTGNLRCCVYSPCGRYFAWASNEVVRVTDSNNGRVLAALSIPNIYELGFSPGGTFFSTWERPGKDEAGDATKNLKVWRTVEDLAEGVDKQPLGRFVQKSQNGWNLQYTNDEKYCARMVTNEVQFYDSNDLTTVWDKLRVEGVSNFALSPGKTHALAVFVPERKGQPAAVKVFNVPQFAAPVSQKTFFKGDKVQLKWNSLGTAILVLAQTDVDKSNMSYYGETTLYLLSVNGSFDARVSLDKEGPIHDVAWSPNSKEFGVIYGYIPAHITIFNQRAVATHSFQKGPRNTIIFSPTGRFVLVAGFGNLAGQIDVYDLERDYRKVCTIESGNPSVCQWSPDSRYIMTATTSPRLRVENGVKLWHVTGSLMYNEDMVELYNVIWRPALLEDLPKGDALHPVPTPHASAATFLSTVKTPSKPAGAYRPPGARGTVTPLHFKREDEGGAAHSAGNGISQLNLNGFGRARHLVPGAEAASGGAGVPGADAADGEDGLSKAASKNKKKRANKKAKEAAAVDGGGASLTLPPGDYGDANGARSPERNGRTYHHSHSRSQSRNNMNGGGGGGRSRSNTHRQGMGEAGPRARSRSARPQNRPGNIQVSNLQGAAQAPVHSPISETAQNPLAKKQRGLQKKIRAIEDLEMRLAGGEKLEDTQMKKIGTKSTVLKELETLEKEMIH